MKKKTQTTYICSKCGRGYLRAKDCTEHEKICGNFCEVGLTILVNGEHFRPSWFTSKDVTANKSLQENLYKVTKTGPYCYGCYCLSDKEGIKKAKETIMDFVIKEADTLKNYFIALRNTKED